MGRHLALAPENPPNPPAPEWHPASNGRGREAAPLSRLRSSLLHPSGGGRSPQERLHRRLPKPEHVRPQPDPATSPAPVAPQHRLRRQAEVVGHLARREKPVVHVESPLCSAGSTASGFP
jgi:hypothetical protein